MHSHKRHSHLPETNNCSIFLAYTSNHLGNPEDAQLIGVRSGTYYLQIENV